MYADLHQYPDGTRHLFAVQFGTGPIKAELLIISESACGYPAASINKLLITGAAAGDHSKFLLLGSPQPNEEAGVVLPEYVTIDLDLSDIGEFDNSVVANGLMGEYIRNGWLRYQQR